jgi:hypothetical protein
MPPDPKPVDPAALDARLAKVEKRLEEPKRKDRWEKWQALSPLINGIVLAVVGYFLTGAVTVGLQRQQFQLSSVKEMRDSLTVIASTKSGTEDIDAAAFMLTAFGPPAVPSLITALLTADERGDVDTRRARILDALRAIGLTEPASVCNPVLKILDNHTGRFSWRTHLAAIQLIGDLECPNSTSRIRQYDERVRRVRTANDLSEYKAVFAGYPPVDRIAIDRLKDELARTRRIIDAH